MARATQWPHGIGKLRDAGIGPLMGCGEGERDMGWDGRPKAPGNSPVGLGNHSPWNGESWANQREPGHRKSEKCPDHRDGREVSAGLRVDPEVPGSMARVHVGSRVSGARGNVERVAPWTPAVDGRHPSASGSRVGTPTREGW